MPTNVLELPLSVIEHSRILNEDDKFVVVPDVLGVVCNIQDDL
jgi:hypothetical protein